MSINPDRISNSGLKVLKVLVALQGYALTGLSNSELSKALGETPSTINRSLNTLIESGLVVKLENGRFAHGIRMLQIAQTTANELSRASDRITELSQRIAAGSHITR